MVHRAARILLLPYLTAALLSTALMIYAVTQAFVWDEGFHLVAAQLIQSGKRPYLDFCFPQTPLNAYWNAAWMSFFGDGWRVPHIAATLLIAATLFLSAHWTLEVLRGSRWRVGCAVINVLLLGANLTLFQFGPIAQAYAMCLFSSFAGFLLIRKATPLRVLGSGLLTGLGAGSSLLIAPVAPVFLLFLAIRKEQRLRNLVLYVVGCAIPFAPVIWLFLQGPHQTFFNVVQYQALFRRTNWGNAGEHDVGVFTAWVDNGSSLLLLLFFLAGCITIWRTRRQSAELLLCLATSIAIILYISTAHPTFARYYIVGAPFYTGVATVGFVWFIERLFPTAPVRWPTVCLAAILILATARFVYTDRDSTTWAQYEKIASHIAKVTPKGGTVFADEEVYFLLHWIPPPGMEFSYAHKLTLPPAEEAKLHIVSEPELKKQTAAHRFAVFQSCNDDRIDEWHVEKFYAHHEDFDDCTVFW